MYFKHIVETGVILLALSAASMALFFSIMFFKVVSIVYFLVVFFLTYSVYGMDRLTSLEEDRLSHPERTLFLQKNRQAFVASVVLSFSVSLTLSATSGWVVALIPIAPLAVMFYSGKLPKSVTFTKSPLKEQFVTKDICVASGWAFLLLVTAVYLNRPIQVGALLFLIPLLLKLFVMAVVYDFKDIKSDRSSGFLTLPVKLGEKPTKLVLHALNATATILILLLIIFGLIPFLALVFIPAFIYQLVVIQKVSQEAPGWVYFVLCDLEQFFWLVFLGLGVGLIGYH